MPAVNRKIKTITLLITVFLGVSPAAGLWAAGTIYTFSEGFDNATHKGAGTTADWNTSQGLLQLPKNITGNTKQVKSGIITLGNFQYYAWVDFRDGIGDNNGHIYLQKYDQNGNKQLVDDVRVDSVYSGSYIADDVFFDYPRLITDGTYIYIYWIHESNMYLQKFDASGNRQWNSGDLLISDVYVSDYNYGYCAAVLNPSNQLVFFFKGSIYEGVGGGDSGMYMQKIDPSVADYMNTARVGSSTKITVREDEPWTWTRINTVTSVDCDSEGNYYVNYSSYGMGFAVCLDKFPAAVSGPADRLWHTELAGAGSLDSSDLATDPSGNSYVVWNEYHNGNRDVFIQKFNSSGVAQWGSAVKMNTDSGSAQQRNPRVRLDSTNAPVALWEDYRNAGKLDIYMQRYDTDGKAQWASEIKVNQGDNNSTYAAYNNGFSTTLAVDSTSDTYYVAWYAYRNSDFDVYGQKVTSDGSNIPGADWEITTEEKGGDFVTSAVAFSDDVLYPNDTPVLTALVYGSYYTKGQTINFYLSNDGVNFESVNMIGSKHTFTTTGNQLFWKADISSTNSSETPVIYSLFIEYTMAGHSAPYHKVLYIYDDIWHYPPTGWMAHENRTDAMTMDSNSHDSPAEGSSCVKITYNPNRAAWAGFYVQASGKWRANGGTGLDLSNYSAMIIRARAADGNGNAIQVQFGVGGDNASSSNMDTCNVKTNWMTLTTSWQTFAIDLSNKTLTDINGLVLVNMRRVQNIDPVIYIDEIQFIGPGPATINDLKASVGSIPGSVKLTWTAPEGDYPNTSYIVKYSQNYIGNEVDFANATAFSQTWIPAAAGTTESYEVTGLTAGQGYYFAVSTVDTTTDDPPQHNQSGHSNTYYCYARSVGLGISVTGDAIDLGELLAGASRSGGPIYVENIGGVPMTTSLSLVNPPGWTADTNNTTSDHYLLMGAFATVISNISWDAPNHAILDAASKSTATKFAGDQTGVNFALDEIRKLWIRFTAPQTMSVGTGTQTIFIEISAETVD